MTHTMICEVHGDKGDNAEQFLLNNRIRTNMQLTHWDVLSIVPPKSLTWNTPWYVLFVVCIATTTYRSIT